MVVCFVTTYFLSPAIFSDSGKLEGVLGVALAIYLTFNKIVFYLDRPFFLKENKEFVEPFHGLLGEPYSRFITDAFDKLLVGLPFPLRLFPQSPLLCHLSVAAVSCPRNRPSLILQIHA